jgi:hypothetical protein
MVANVLFSNEFKLRSTCQSASYKKQLIRKIGEKMRSMNKIMARKHGVKIPVGATIPSPVGRPHVIKMGLGREMSKKRKQILQDTELIEKDHDPFTSLAIVSSLDATKTELVELQRKIRSEQLLTSPSYTAEDVIPATKRKKPISFHTDTQQEKESSGSQDKTNEASFRVAFHVDSPICAQPFPPVGVPIQKK